MIVTWLLYNTESMRRQYEAFDTVNGCEIDVQSVNIWYVMKNDWVTLRVWWQTVEIWLQWSKVQYNVLRIAVCDGTACEISMLGILDMIKETEMIDKFEFSTVSGTILLTHSWNKTEKGCCALSVSWMLLCFKNVTCEADHRVDNWRGLWFNISFWAFFKNK